MKTTISVYDFRDAFERRGRKDQFSYTGLGFLHEYLEEMEESTGVEIELDVVGLCCDYVEMTFEEVVDSYDTGITEENYCDKRVWEWLQEQTTVVYFDLDRVMFQQF